MALPYSSSSTICSIEFCGATFIDKIEKTCPRYLSTQSHAFLFSLQILTIRLNYKLQWRESRMSVNESADWNSGEINISPDNIDVSK